MSYKEKTVNLFPVKRMNSMFTFAQTHKSFDRKKTYRDLLVTITNALTADTVNFPLLISHVDKVIDSNLFTLLIYADG